MTCVILLFARFNYDFVLLPPYPLEIDGWHILKIFEYLFYIRFFLLMYKAYMCYFL